MTDARTRRDRATVLEQTWQTAAVAGIGIITGVLVALLGSWQLAPLLGWDVAALTYLVRTWVTIWPQDHEETAQLAAEEDPPRVTSDALLLLAAVASLAAVALVLVRASNANGASAVGFAGLAVVSVVLSWVVVHTTFTLRYARIYYTGPDGGVNFNQPKPPRYSDFAYLAFTIGMTFQVSDTALTSWPMRATALRQALLSYLFGVVIIAATINLVVGLGR